MSWLELLERYLESLKTRGLSDSTQRDARHWLGLFVQCCRDHQADAPADVQPRHLTLFQKRMLWEPHSQGRLYSPNSVSHAMGLARSFLGWATERGVLLMNPARNLVLPRPVQPTRYPATAAEVDLLISALGRTDFPLRNQAIGEVFYQTGVRLSECAGLDLADIDLAELTLMVRCGKGAKDRRLPLSDHLAALLQRYLQESRTKLARDPQETALFLARDGPRLGGQRISQLLKQASRSAGLPRNLSPHLLRYTFATHLLEGGADLRYIQEMLGHTNVHITALYTKVSARELATEYRQTHPRAGRAEPPQTC